MIPADRERPSEEELERYRRAYTTVNTARWPDRTVSLPMLDISTATDDPPYDGRYLPRKTKG